MWIQNPETPTVNPTEFCVHNIRIRIVFHAGTLLGSKGLGNIIWLANEKPPCLIVHHLNGNSQVVAGKALKPVDTTGAGDAFVSGLLAGLSAVEDWKNEDVLVDVIRKANASGALATTAKGAMSALPNKAELDAFLAN